MKFLVSAMIVFLFMSFPVMSFGFGEYDGPLFDAMAQIDHNVDFDEAIERVKAAGVSGMALFARSKKLGQNEKAVLRLAGKNKGFIILGAPKYFGFGNDIGSDYIRATVEGVKRHGYRFVGEILYTHADKKHGRIMPGGETYIDPMLPGTKQFLEALAPLDVPLMTHWEPYALERDAHRFHALYDAYPDQIFIVPHMGFAKADTVREFLERHPNLYMTISKRERKNSILQDQSKLEFWGTRLTTDDGSLAPEWRPVLERFHDRLLFGTDAHKKFAWDRYSKPIPKFRVILGQLDREKAENIAYKNAEKIYGFKLGQEEQ